MLSRKPYLFLERLSAELSGREFLLNFPCVPGSWAAWIPEQGSLWGSSCHPQCPPHPLLGTLTPAGPACRALFSQTAAPDAERGSPSGCCSGSLTWRGCSSQAVFAAREHDRLSPSLRFPRAQLIRHANAAGSPSRLRIPSRIFSKLLTASFQKRLKDIFS